jgi:hypothetical protein
MQIDRAGGSVAAHEAADWLESLDPATADLDFVRADLIDHILALREMR